MKKIEVKILNPEAVYESEKMMVCAARLTQRGEKIKSMDDFIALYNRDYSARNAQSLSALPHPTIQKFGVINVVVVGASRRFLAQITRHQNEVKFMSASLQYSDYSDEADFCVPYAYLQNSDVTQMYLNVCAKAMIEYKEFMGNCANNDAAGYMAPQGLRNILIISATPYQWKHMIRQRTCRRNTDETRYVMLRIWEQLFELNAELFTPAQTGPRCIDASCEEGHMSCGVPDYAEIHVDPTHIIERDFPLLVN